MNSCSASFTFERVSQTNGGVCSLESIFRNETLLLVWREVLCYFT